MQPTRYAPTSEVFSNLLEISGYLRDLGEHTIDPFLTPSIPAKLQVELVNPVVEKRVREQLREIHRETKSNQIRWTRRMGHAFEVLKRMRERAQAGDEASLEVLNEKREYDFAEVLPGYKQTLTLAEMLNEVSTDRWNGSPCMNLLGGQLQEYIVELYRLPKRPKK